MQGCQFRQLFRLHMLRDEAMQKKCFSGLECPYIKSLLALGHASLKGTDCCGDSQAVMC